MSLNRLDMYFEIANKDTLVDLLLEEGYDDFYFFPCNRYGAGAFLVSTEEQVSARRDFGLFRLFLQQSEAIVLALAIKKELKDKTIKIFIDEVKEL
ncbi:hypothetical protein B649_01990 [Candidatus Sulfuricurvum sp. RIFRC-1]|nr:hypothetical protein B649_01990 [Candidatus Sulfuricurvum sp. RIFRC-1]OHD84095.1 MAG: hypothetical protein A3D90_11545 [Sulfuricurvum sp. RIFCSPHIGHO2_02_FULL_43_9]OHD87981.1 MAG: hypothetical protein A2Y52_09460 [Sulfuricurvum sp. RIFCSPLOWO2_02_43_6]OHD89729.1 MAG: hypothetical protein A3G19_01285 [Sulfuricurvum sp. RIFCSPLOWO2_12_FULL_43_24]OHD90021.1 MAG: hypothetical protein A3J39_04785 [Sulfuricurvum sp. RIFCSPHIGHO2_12_FULL_44_8]HBM36163.1 DUF3240 domain-containing protein [Sulfuricu